MEPEEITPSKSKKFIKIALGAGAAFAFLFGTAFILTELKSGKQEKQVEVQIVALPSPQKVFTQEEKSQILAHIAQEALKDTTPQTDKVRILDAIAKKEPRPPVVLNDEKTRILQELAAKTGQ